MKELTLRCKCDSIGHQLYLIYDEDYEEIMVYYQIEGIGLWQRLKEAIKFIFNNEPLLQQDLLLDNVRVQELLEFLKIYTVEMGRKNDIKIK